MVSQDKITCAGLLVLQIPKGYKYKAHEDTEFNIIKTVQNIDLSVQNIDLSV